HAEQPSIRTTFNEVDNLPIPNIYFNHLYDFTIVCSLTSGIATSDCTEFIINTRQNNPEISAYSYTGAFQPNNSAISRTNGVLFDLLIFITDPQYNSSNQTSFMEMVAFDKGKAFYEIFVNYLTVVNMKVND
ncbi:10079_t:CDS:2, partial [Dentiscutata heterogama]